MGSPDRRRRDVPVEVDRRRAEISHTIEVSERIIERGPAPGADPVVHHMITEELELENVAKADKARSDEAEKVAQAKAANGAFWPLDMNTPFGRGETDDPEVPEWGLDQRKSPPAAAPPPPAE